MFRKNMEIEKFVMIFERYREFINLTFEKTQKADLEELLKDSSDQDTFPELCET